MRKIYKYIFLGCILFSFQINAQGLRTSGKNIINKNGEEVLLRGYGPGGWQIMEGYMMQTSGIAGSQHEIKEKLIDLMGVTHTETFFNKWRENHFTKRDVDSIAAWGFNSIRIPMHYNLFTLPIEEEPIEGQNTWLETGFELIDNVLSWAAPHNMYIILDMHATPGGQGGGSEINDYDPDKPSLWESQQNRDKLVALWTRIAERYKSNEWIGGYDLINETHWDLGNQNTLLREVYEDITAGIRGVGDNHILYIEGNSYANDHRGLLPPWDDNLVYSFHKYWTFNNSTDLDWILPLREQYNVPLWMGESGENSNTWFTDAITLFENNNIGWAWWAVRKIGDIDSPYAVDINPGYQKVIDFWKGEGAKPTEQETFDAMMQLSDNLLVDNSKYRKDVPDAIIRQVQTDEIIPYHGSPSSIPGIIYLSDYDLGKNNFAYYDAVVADYNLSTGNFTAWNSGWNYRNDGVDIQTNEDQMNSNGYHIGYTEKNEWLKYTVNIAETSFYNFNFRYATEQSGCKVKLFMDDVDVSGSIAIGNTGGWSNFVNQFVENIYLEQGIHVLKVKVDGSSSFNMSSIEFMKSSVSLNDFKVLSASTADDEKSIQITLNQLANDVLLSKDDFEVKVNNQVVSIESVLLDADSKRFVTLKLEDFLFHQNQIQVSYSGTIIQSSNNIDLPVFNNLNVENNLLTRAFIPGKIEAENYSSQEGLQTENTSDTGGGKNLGYTDVGDYAEYKIFVSKDGNYQLDIRSAAQNNSGSIDFEIVNENSVENLTSVNLPITGGWQSWFTSSTSVVLNKGVYTLRMKIVKSGFNLNWFEFKFVNSLSTEILAKESITVFPNPVSDNFQIKIQNQLTVNNVKVFDFSGRLVKEIKPIHQQVNYSLSNLKSGIYLVVIETDSGKFNRKLIKK